MGTSISFGTYEAEKIKEPWEKHQYRDVSKAFYTQSVNRMINKLNYCVTALTSLELHECYVDPDDKHNEFEPTVPKINYLSAVTIYLNNIGKIIGGERMLTEFKVIFDKNSPSSAREYKIDNSYPIRRKKENCVDGKELHNHVIKNKKIQFRNGNFYVIKTFHKYIKEASICNRRTDVNYTNMKVTENRDELNQLLGNLALLGGSIGFVEAKGAEVLAKGVEVFCYALDIEPKIGVAERMFPIKGPVHLDKLTTYKYFKAVQGEDLEFTQIERSAKERKSVPFDETDILEKLENFGLKIKK
ncbi:hypothetical protein [Flavobacterium sp.]|uniref:hypothetical protein n=1 Tax=Flavobacterium sp. TaxID=239 RepID=UPI00286DF5C4|nr:hypothetical protein [Flavobacterium sp.]